MNFLPEGVELSYEDGKKKSSLSLSLSLSFTCYGTYAYVRTWQKKMDFGWIREMFRKKNFFSNASYGLQCTQHDDQISTRYSIEV